MVEEAQKLAKLSEHVVVKIPLIPDGIKAIRTLSRKGIKTNATLVFSPLQALLAAKAGASYVSPFIGRMDDIGNTGMTIVEEIMDIFINYGYDTKVIVASFRHTQHVLESSLIVADVVTMTFGVLEKMFKHPMTDIGLENFLKDWEKYQNISRIKIRIEQKRAFRHVFYYFVINTSYLETLASQVRFLL